MKFYGDYHTHSVYSDGRAKISDAALYAGKIGLKELAITDHGFANVTLSLTEKKFEKEIIDVKRQGKTLKTSICCLAWRRISSTRRAILT